MKTSYGNGIHNQIIQVYPVLNATSTLAQPTIHSRKTMTRPLQFLIVACMMALSGFEWIPFDIMKGNKIVNGVAYVLDSDPFKGGTNYHPKGKKVHLPLSELTQSRVTSCQSFFSPELEKMVPRTWIENI